MIEVLDQDVCVPCGICLEVCPMDVFGHDPVANRYRIVHRDDCMACFNCELECPTGAIDVAPWRKPRRQAWPAAGGDDPSASDAGGNPGPPDPCPPPTPRPWTR